MINKFLRQYLINVSAKLSLWLVDTLEATRYDSHIYVFLNNSNIAYQKYTLSFRFDYDNRTNKLWQAFVFSQENRWELIELPNPFYKANPDQISSPRDENKDLTVLLEGMR